MHEINDLLDVLLIFDSSPLVGCLESGSWFRVSLSTFFRLAVKVGRIHVVVYGLGFRVFFRGP